VGKLPLPKLDLGLIGIFFLIAILKY